ncbi:NmrA family NAD(P)-binding protein [Pseudonocardia acidicola]|uniref:NmrA family NAD(P)-binding protein n=1 Tax=Pseudonocardia acidicola TaxID=2724939 RepID=A0ABX1SB86_9PSEU|nr:NmrA family NAD(P)-binding protein [Pseudonocardia acidicola]NMH98815.1 NmrA family NAD(P)-binding protein [Pseudonocardia acidicola]
MIAVTGVTGRLGRVVIEDLLTKVPADQLVAIVRNPEKARDLAERGVQVRHGDYDDPDSLVAAFTDADHLLFVSSPDVRPGVRTRQHMHVVDAAVRAAVGHIAYTSAIKADQGVGFLEDHAVTEHLIRETAITYTFLRNTFYTEVFVNPPSVQAAVQSGELRAADGGKPLNTATIRDLGLAASAVLTGSGHENRVYELCGPLWTYPQLADAISELSGKPVAYREIPIEEAGEMAFVFQLVRDGFFAGSTDDLPKLLGRPATGIREAVKALLAG